MYWDIFTGRFSASLSSLSFHEFGFVNAGTHTRFISCSQACKRGHGPGHRLSRLATLRCRALRLDRHHHHHLRCPDIEQRPKYWLRRPGRRHHLALRRPGRHRCRTCQKAPNRVWILGKMTRRWGATVATGGTSTGFVACKTATESSPRRPRGRRFLNLRDPRHSQIALIERVDNPHCNGKNINDILR